MIHLLRHYFIKLVGVKMVKEYNVTTEILISQYQRLFTLKTSIAVKPSITLSLTAILVLYMV